MTGVAEVPSDAKPTIRVGEIVEDTRYPDHAGRLPMGRVLRVDAERREADAHFEDDHYPSLGVPLMYLRAAAPENARRFRPRAPHGDAGAIAARREAKLG